MPDPLLIIGDILLATGLISAASIFLGLFVLLPSLILVLPGFLISPFIAVYSCIKNRKSSQPAISIAARDFFRSLCMLLPFFLNTRADSVKSPDRGCVTASYVYVYLTWFIGCGFGGTFVLLALLQYFGFDPLLPATDAIKRVVAVAAIVVVGPCIYSAAVLWRSNDLNRRIALLQGEDYRDSISIAPFALTTVWIWIILIFTMIGIDNIGAAGSKFWDEDDFSILLEFTYTSRLFDYVDTLIFVLTFIVALQIIGTIVWTVRSFTSLVRLELDHRRVARKVGTTDA